MSARIFLLGLTFTSLLASAAMADREGGGDSAEKADRKPVGLLKTVRQATRMYHDPVLAEADGWVNTARCVSAPEEGALGIHFVNVPLLLDGTLDAERPELLNYEMVNGRLKLVAVEYVVFADEWDAAHPDGTPPILMGQLFDYIAAPNRYRLPALYTLHVWAWKRNPHGTFVLYNPRVSCDGYEG